MDELLSARDVIREKLFFCPLRRPDALRHSVLASSSLCFSIDNELVYEPFFADFGPLNLACTYRFCWKCDDLLKEAEVQAKRVYFCCAADPHKKANAAVLVGAYAILFHGLSPEEAYKPLAVFEPYVPFRDPTCGASTYHLTVLDCLRAVAKGKAVGWIDMKTFKIEEYEYLEQVENGDINWVVPNKILAFSGPSAKRTHIYGYRTFVPEDYVDYFHQAGVKGVIRLNKRVYDRRRFTDYGIAHYDLYFPDGSCPTDAIVKKFLEIVENHPGSLAVHCKAGLGRTGVLVGCYIMKHYHFTANEVLGYLRIVRPGSVIGPQQHFLRDMQLRMWKAGDAMWQQQQQSRELPGSVPAPSSSSSSSLLYKTGIVSTTTTISSSSSGLPFQSAPVHAAHAAWTADTTTTTTATTTTSAIASTAPMPASAAAVGGTASSSPSGFRRRGNSFTGGGLISSGAAAGLATTTTRSSSIRRRSSTSSGRASAPDQIQGSGGGGSSHHPHHHHHHHQVVQRVYGSGASLRDSAPSSVPARIRPSSRHNHLANSLTSSISTSLQQRASTSASPESRAIAGMGSSYHEAQSGGGGSTNMNMNSRTRSYPKSANAAAAVAAKSVMEGDVKGYAVAALPSRQSGSNGPTPSTTTTTTTTTSKALFSGGGSLGGSVAVATRARRLSASAVGAASATNGTPLSGTTSQQLSQHHHHHHPHPHYHHNHQQAGAPFLTDHYPHNNTGGGGHMSRPAAMGLPPGPSISKGKAGTGVVVQRIINAAGQPRKVVVPAGGAYSGSGSHNPCHQNTMGLGMMRRSISQGNNSNINTFEVDHGGGTVLDTRQSSRAFPL